MHCRVIVQAINQGVDKILATGVSLSESMATIDIIKKLDPNNTHLFSTAGVHPTNSNVSSQSHFVMQGIVASLHSSNSYPAGLSEV